MVKKTFILVFALMMTLSFSSITFANEEYDDLPEGFIELPEGYFEDERLQLVENPGSSDIGTDSIVRTVKYSKVNVSLYEEWSGFRRVSDNFYGPGSVTANRETTFNTIVSGGWQYLGFSTTVSKTSSKSYTLQATKAQRVYMGYRVKYRVETGFRVGKIGTREISREAYTIKIPQYGEYKLLDYIDGKIIQ